MSSVYPPVVPGDLSASSKAVSVAPSTAPLDVLPTTGPSHLSSVAVVGGLLLAMGIALVAVVRKARP